MSLSAPLVVGVSACLEDRPRGATQRAYWALARHYTRAIRCAGATPLVITPDVPVAEVLRLCSGVVLSGGGDLPEELEKPETAQRAPGPLEAAERVEWERELLDAMARANRAVLGICFGMQLMNLHFGGSLIVNLHDHALAAAHTHPAQALTHECVLTENSAFFAAAPRQLVVSSHHGQAVGRVAPGFVVGARAPDGVIEAIERPPFVGVQWHPETDATEALVFGTFLRWAGGTHSPGR